MTLHFSSEEFERRRKALLVEMENRGLEAMLLFAQESLYWRTGVSILFVDAEDLPRFFHLVFQEILVRADR